MSCAFIAARSRSATTAVVASCREPTPAARRALVALDAHDGDPAALAEHDHVGFRARGPAHALVAVEV